MAQVQTADRASPPVRERRTWVRWDKEAMCNRTSHPYLWIATEPDGYERCFDTKREAQAWIDDYNAELDYVADRSIDDFDTYVQDAKEAS